MNTLTAALVALLLSMCVLASLGFTSSVAGRGMRASGLFHQAAKSMRMSGDAVPVVPVAVDISAVKEGIKQLTNLNGSDVRVGIIMARWNADIITGLYAGVNESLAACGVKPSNVFTTYVPGAFELPVTAKLLAASKRVDVIINLGCLIKGDTMHFEYIAGAVSQGLMQVSLSTMIPCVFGVLTVMDKEQATKRSTGSHNEGLSWGTSAVEMGLARMAAMGVGVAKKEESNTPFVTFSGNLTSDGKNATSTSKPKKIGF
jgi:6,7-dimethyl-8-ribityllumazine synthase